MSTPPEVFASSIWMPEQWNANPVRAPRPSVFRDRARYGRLSTAQLGPVGGWAVESNNPRSSYLVHSSSTINRFERVERHL